MESAVSNYPGVITTDTGDDSSKHAYAATLTAHAAGSVERNQDAQFSASRDLLLCRDVVAGAKDARIESLVNRYELASQLKDFEIRNLERHGEVKAELAAMRAESLQRDIATLRSDAQGSVLSQLLEVVKGLAAK